MTCPAVPILSNESAQRNDAGHIIDEMSSKNTRPFCNLRLRASTLQANAKKPFIVPNIKPTTGLAAAILKLQWPPPVVGLTQHILALFIYLRTGSGISTFCHVYVLRYCVSHLYIRIHLTLGINETLDSEFNIRWFRTQSTKGHSSCAINWLTRRHFQREVSLKWKKCNILELFNIVP